MKNSGAIVVLICIMIILAAIGGMFYMHLFEAYDLPWWFIFFIK